MVGPNQLVRRCSPLVVPVVRGEVAMVTVIFSSSFLSSPHFSLTEFSIARLQIPPFFSPSISRSPLSQSSHRILWLPRLLFLSDFCASAPFALFISHSFHISSLFQPIHYQFLLNIFITPSSALLFLCSCHRF